ncbi:hypothetical protein [Mumia sp. DW29H23]|uniref:hypothetical protein n=1 Tax=Mumia sp. DW29H23 TaxID=3421241 RepID=UPI003D69CB78
MNRLTRRTTLILLAAAGVLGTAAVGGWMYASAQAVGDVQVTAGADVTCADPASLKGRAVPSNVPVWPKLVVDSRLDCRIPVVVSNASGVTVTVTEMQWPHLAGPPSSGVGVKAVPGDPAQTAQGVPADGFETDALLTFRDGLRVESGESVVVWTRLLATGDCVPGDLEAQFVKVPEVTIEALGRPHHRATEEGLLSWRGPRGETCGI